MRRAILIGLVLLLAASIAACSKSTDSTSSSSGSTTSSVKLINSSSYSVISWYISPSSSSTWGSDQLGSRTVSQGSTFTVGGIPCGTNYDFRADISGDSSHWTRYGAYVSCGTTGTWTVY